MGSWNALPTIPVTFTSVNALVMNGTNNLFVGGVANQIASWDGNSWSILGTNSTSNGVNGQVNALAMNGTNQLFVGGSFSSIDGNLILAGNIALWNGELWSSFGTKSDGTVNAITTIFGTSFLVGGQFRFSPDGFCTPFLMQGKF